MKNLLLRVNMNQMLKTFLTLIISTLLLINLTGCANGNTKDPLKPVGVKSQTDKKLSTVVFYRSDDSFGSLDFGEITAKVDDVSAGIMSEAVAFYPGGYLIDGTRGLEFRTKENFLKSTTTASQIEYTGEKCSQWSGCPKQVVNLLN